MRGGNQARGDFHRIVDFSGDWRAVETLSMAFGEQGQVPASAELIAYPLPFENYGGCNLDVLWWECLFRH